MARDFDLNKYSKLFVSECREYLRILNDAMVELESAPKNKDLVNQMFRSCHTLKGMAGMMNLTAITNTAHALEDILGAIREEQVPVNKEVAEAIFDALDALESMVAQVESTLDIEEMPGLVDRLAALKDMKPKPKKGRKPKAKKVEQESPEKSAQQKTTVSVRLARRCSLPSARAMVILRELEKSGHIISSIPTEDDIESEKPFENILIELEPGPKFEAALSRIAAMTDVEELLEGSKSQPMEQWRSLARPGKKVAAAKETPLVQTVKVGMDKLDDLLDDVSELVIGRSRLVEKAQTRDDLELQEISSLIDLLTAGIQEKVLSIRMIPLEVMMSRYPRLVRDLSKGQGKEVDFVVEGGNIELDRTVVDKIADPVIHIIRNCIDHGIEAPDERHEAGKNPKGLIRVVASKQQDHVLIEISDDGRGLDFDKIRSTAVSKGLMTREEAEGALGRELLDMLFHPGFSTKTEVTETSGRGVGLDVVRKAVEELGGSVMISTSKGAGSTISLWLPFTLAIIDAMMVFIADQMYAVPMSVVAESHRFEAVEVKLIRNREVVQLRGEVLPLVRMREFFGIRDIMRDEPVNVLVVQSRERRAALVVDELVGHQQIVVKSLDKRLRRTRGISGGTILGSGRIALILDVDSILGE